jgi:7-carboxy-7-deazaguanine synthase
METQISINTIYRASEGEGIYIGTPQIFIRFQGCNIGCVNCDSKETWDFDEQKSRNLENILDEVEALAHRSHYPLKRVSITGGDPLHPSHHEGLLKLVKELKQRNYWINLEAAGTRVVREIFDLVDFISFDVKTPSTEVRTSRELLKKVHQDYGEKLQIKAVISDEKDFNYVEEAFHWIEKEIGFHLIPWVLTPAHNLEDTKAVSRFELIQKMNELRGERFRVIGQQHKWVYGSGRMDV